MVRIKKKHIFDFEEFKIESLANQMAMLRRYLNDRYSIQYMTSYLLIDGIERVMLLDTSSDGLLELKNIDLESIQIKVNKKCLQDSKDRKIKARYSIPMTVRKDKRVLLILEDKKVDRFDLKERDILQEIEDIFDSIN